MRKLVVAQRAMLGVFLRDRIRNEIFLEWRPRTGRGPIVIEIFGDLPAFCG
ncbi:unnamed protein product [Leptidea sinapis]|uniref:Uncharacterized protein n=1 Tax=Leptidea sinapis TaxID=189913 RepID=A0A5E4PRY1_9NEOP|nr:unnamed protein product [Leptidea sinapis]